MAYQWKDKVVVITGGAGGIGALVVRKLIEFEHVKHVVIFDINKEGAAFVKELNTKFGGGKATFFQCDVTNDDEVDDGFKMIINQFGYLDVLINNAGFMNDSYPTYKKMIAVNLTALITCTLKALDLMRKDEGGRGGTIINIGSIANLMQHCLAPSYFATKSAVLQFTLCLSDDDYFSRTAVRMITICFGASDTSILQPQNMGHFDKSIRCRLKELVGEFYIQKADNAAIGLVEAYKRGKNGSTWVSVDDKPAKDITEEVTKAYKILSDTVL